MAHILKVAASVAVLLLRILYALKRKCVTVEVSEYLSKRQNFNFSLAMPA